MTHNDFNKEWKRELDFWFNSVEGKELALNSVAQGHRIKLAVVYMGLFGSGFTALELIRKLEEELNN